VYIPGIVQFFPEAIQELKGIADGSGIELVDVVFLNARYDLARVRGSKTRPCPPRREPTANGATRTGKNREANLPANGIVLNGEENSDGINECTTAGFLMESTVNGDVILAQNWDNSANIVLKELAVYLEIHPDPSEELPVMFVMTEAGTLGRSGVNSSGLALCASSLLSSEDYFPLDYSLPPGAKQEPLLPISLIRRQFLQNSNFGNALVNIQTAPKHVSNTLMVGTADNFVMGLEVTPTTTHLCYPEGKDNFVVHANHFTSQSFHASPWTDLYPGGGSWYRAVRVARAVRPFNDAGLTREKITEGFSDHLSLPTSVCQHIEECTTKNTPDYPYQGAQITVAHLSYNLTQRTATVCKGPPCMGKFDTFKLPKTENV
jgi:isopenicillin-N N-acyltransferase-like protein